MQKLLTFFQQKISAYLRITQSLTNDIVSFEQLGPGLWGHYILGFWNLYGLKTNDKLKHSESEKLLFMCSYLSCLSVLPTIGTQVSSELTVFVCAFSEFCVLLGICCSGCLFCEPPTLYTTCLWEFTSIHRVSFVYCKYTAC